MKLIKWGRNSGKTTEAIKIAAENFAYMVVRTQDEARRVASMARDMGLDIPFPITFHEFVTGAFSPRGCRAFVVDGLDALVDYHRRGVPILAATWDTEGPPLVLNEVARRVRAWRLRQFGEQTLTRHALQVCEEAGEVARAVGKAEEGIRPETRGDLGSELADVILSACGLAAAAGIDLDAIVAARLERVERLDFRKNPESGQKEGA